MASGWQELVAVRGDSYRLTPEGRKYALRVVRIHRLWERYLAEETGLGPDAWHSEAEVREHTTSPEKAEELVSAMERHQVLPMSVDGSVLTLGFTRDPSAETIERARNFVPGMELQTVLIDGATFSEAMKTCSGLATSKGNPPTQSIQS